MELVSLDKDDEEIMRSCGVNKVLMPVGDFHLLSIFFFFFQQKGKLMKRNGVCIDFLGVIIF